MKTAAVIMPVSRRRIADFVTLTKPRLNSLVVVTAGLGYYLGAGGQIEASTLFHTIVGAALVAGGAAAFNQVAERDLDELMVRTRQRPLPVGRLLPTEARLFAFVLSAIGIFQLAYVTSWIAAFVAFITLVSYVAIYTPLKRRTPWATLVGAVPGALPPVIGWAAATGSVTIEAWVLFGIVFLWQLPHFHALAWLYRDDFRGAGLPLLAVLDPSGRRTSTHALIYTIALLPMSLVAALVGLGGTMYVAGASLLGIIFIAVAAGFVAQHSTGRARILFRTSLIYLPLLWGLLVAEHAF
jgi:protoheme IX farnesyltransferase